MTSSFLGLIYEQHPLMAPSETSAHCQNHVFPFMATKTLLQVSESHLLEVPARVF